MPSRNPRRTTRRLLTVASMGLAGLLAGLLTGCSASPFSSSLASYSPGRHFTSYDRYTFRHSNPDNQPIPDFKHAPSPHRNESWAVRTTQQPGTAQLDSGRTLADYQFITPNSSTQIAMR